MRSLLVIGALCVGAVVCRADENWLAFRGGSNVDAASRAAPAFELSAETKPLWSAELPGRGPSSPIVVGGKVVVTASSGSKQDRLHVLAFDAESGEKSWERQFWATGRTNTHPSSAVAANSPCSDGERIFAFYSSNDLVCLDLDGRLLWFRGLAYDYPSAGNDVGMSSSPIVAGAGVVVQIENQGDSFVASLDRTTGQTLWRVERPREASWASPTAIVGENGEVAAILVQSKGKTSALDPATGEELWSVDKEPDLISSAVQQGDRLIVPLEGLTAMKLDGDRRSLPTTVWTSSRLRPGAASPVLGGGFALILNRSGVLAAALPESGEQIWQTRLDGSFWASPVVVGDRVYCVNYDGLVQAVSLSGDHETLGSLPLGEAVQGTPAVSDGALFIRSDRHLFKVGAPATK